MISNYTYFYPTFHRLSVQIDIQYINEVCIRLFSIEILESDSILFINTSNYTYNTYYFSLYFHEAYHILKLNMRNFIKLLFLITIQLFK